MTTDPHDFPHGGGTHSLGEHDLSRCAATLPLLGSNQDSSDPESLAQRHTLANDTHENTRKRAAAHTLSHTVRHRALAFRAARAARIALASAAGRGAR